MKSNLWSENRSAAESKKGAIDMKTRNKLFTKPVSLGLLAGVLVCLPTSNPQAQILIFGGTSSTAASTSFQGNAAAVTGFAAGNAVSVANSGALAASGGAQEAAAL